MMKKKKLFTAVILLLAVFFVLGVAACGGNKSVYKVTFDYGAGAGEIESITIDGEFIPVLPVPTSMPSGKKFDGWKDEKGNTVKSGSKFDYAKDITLKAEYVTAVYKITYASDGVSVDTDAFDGTPVFEYSLSDSAITLPSAIKTGNTFVGWRIDGSDEIISEIPAGTMQDFALIATWRVNTYVISFDYSGGSGTESLSVKYGGRITELPIPDVCPTGKRFINWKDENGEFVLNGTPMLFAKDVVFTAEYADIHYTISYYDLKQAEMGEHPMAYVFSETAVALPVLKKDGYTFKGWKCGDEIITEIPAGTFGDLSLTAVWETNEYTIKFNYNGGSGETGSIKVKFGENIDNLPIPDICPAGRNFINWKDENGTVVLNGTPMTYLKDVTFTAEYEAFDYLIQYNVNGGKVVGELINGYSVSETAILLPTAEKDGYTFKGWKCGEDIITEISAETFGNLSLTAVWETNEYTITFEYNGGAGTVAYKYVTFGKEINDLPTPDESPTGKKFAGWKDEYGNSVIDGTIMTYLKDITLIAEYEFIEYKISYDLNGGKLDGQEISVYTYGSRVELPRAEKSGYEFKGWRKGDDVITAISANSTGDIELVAEFWGQKYEIGYDLNGGTLPENAMEEYRVSETDVELPVPTKDGYNFVGWNIDGKRITFIAAGTMGDLFLVAEWEEKTDVFTITFDNSSNSNITDWTDGTTGVKKIAVEYGGTITVPTIKYDVMSKDAINNDDYKFNYWYYIDKSGNKIRFDKTLTLTAENFPDINDLNITLYVYVVKQWAGPY